MGRGGECVWQAQEETEMWEQWRGEKMGAARTRGRREGETKTGWWWRGRWERMYGEEGSGSGAIQGGGRGGEERGRSQSTTSSSSSSSDEEGEDPPHDEMKIKRVCKGGGGESEGGETDSEGEGEYVQWVREEMEQLEEQGEWEQTWGEYKDRSKRRREWDRGGWERWEIKEEVVGEAMATQQLQPRQALGSHKNT